MDDFIELKKCWDFKKCIYLVCVYRGKCLCYGEYVEYRLFFESRFLFLSCVDYGLSLVF